MKWTEPSAKTWLAPPVWNEYVSLSLSQLIGQFPDGPEPSRPYSENGSPQPPPSVPLSIPTNRPPTQCCGRPASSEISSVFDVPSMMLTIVRFPSHGDDR